MSGSWAETERAVVRRARLRVSVLVGLVITVLVAFVGGIAYVAEWNRAGVWQRLHEVLLAELHGAGKLDWSRAPVYRCRCR